MFLKQLLYAYTGTYELHSARQTVVQSIPVKQVPEKMPASSGLIHE